MGTPRQLGMIAIGRDACAVDATCARVIGLDPDRIPYLDESGTVPRAHEGVPNRSQRRARGPFRHDVRGCRFLQVQPPGQELIASEPVARSRGRRRSLCGSGQNSACHTYSGSAEVQRICVAAVRRHRHPLCDSTVRTRDRMYTVDQMLKPGFGAFVARGGCPRPGGRSRVAARAQRSPPPLTYTFTPPGVWRSGPRPRQVNTRCLASPDCWPPARGYRRTGTVAAAGR